MKMIDLCAGIGGFSRAGHWLGIETVAFVEIEAWNRRVLAKHWPDAYYHDDVHTFRKGNVPDELFDGSIDVVTGGFPCQPFSVAGKREGVNDPRHLWPSLAEIVGQVRPAYALFENVPGIVTDRNMALDTVLSDLEALGYTAGPVVIPACAVNALHIRERVWIMAYRDQPNGETRRANRLGAREPACTCRCAGRDPSDSHTDRGQRERPDETQRTGRDAADRLRASGTVADADENDASQPAGIHRPGNGAQVQQQRGRLRDESRGSGDVPLMAHATTRGLRRGRAPGHERQPAQRGEGVGNTEGAGRYPSGRDKAQAGTVGSPDESGEPTRCTEHEASRSVDAGPHGFRAGLVRRPAARSAWDDPDMIRAMWADGSWEIDLPRVVAEEAERRQKLEAAGNAIVSIVAYEILRVMLGGEADCA